MRRARLFLLFLCCVAANAFAETYSEEEFEKLRDQIRDVSSQSPALAISKTDSIIAQHKDKLSIAQQIRMLYSKAWYQIQTDDIDNAFKTLADCKHMSAQTDYPNILYSYYGITASAFIQLSMYEKALENHMMAYEIAAQMDTEQYLRQTENNIGHVYLKLERYEEARDFFQRFYEHAEQNNMEGPIATGLNNIGESYYGQGDYEQALTYHLRSLEIRNRRNWTYASSWSHHNLGRTYSKLGVFDKAQFHLERAIEIRVQGDAEADALAPRIDYVQMQLARGDIGNIENSLEEIVMLSDKYGRMIEKSKALGLLRDLYRKQGKLAKALDATNAYMQAHFDLLKKQSEVGVTYYVVQMDLAVKEKELAAKEKDIAEKKKDIEKLTELNQLQKANTEAVKTQLIIVIVSGVIISFVIAFFVWRLRGKNHKLADALNHLQETQKQLLEAEKMSAMTTLVTGMAHQLNTPLGLVVTSSSILEDKLTEVRQKLQDKSLSSKELEKFLDDAEETLALTSRNSSKASDLITRFKMISASLEGSEPSSFKVKSYLEEKCRLVLQTLPLKLNLNISGDDPQVFSHPEVLLKAISQLLDNSCAHGFSHVDKPGANIAITESDKGVVLTYCDNGTGIGKDKIKQVFDPFYTSKLGQGKLGLGLNIVYNSVVHVLKGNVECREAADGACFVITLPLALEDEPSA